MTSLVMTKTNPVIGLWKEKDKGLEKGPCVVEFRPVGGWVAVLCDSFLGCYETVQRMGINRGSSMNLAANSRYPRAG